MNNKIRQLFPIFNHHKNLVYLDSAATSLKPKSVIQAVIDYYEILVFLIFFLRNFTNNNQPKKKPIKQEPTKSE